MTSSLEGGEWGGVSQKLKIDDMMTRWWATWMMTVFVLKQPREAFKEEQSRPPRRAVATEFRPIQLFKKIDSEPEKKDPKYVKVRVKRQDYKTSEGNVMDEFTTFLEKIITNFDRQHLKYPPGFKYDQNKIQEAAGPTDISQDQVEGRKVDKYAEEDRARDVQGLRGEEMV